MNIAAIKNPAVIRRVFQNDVKGVGSALEA
jgi:hypothetical protein